jgi:hypothetical protein
MPWSWAAIRTVSPKMTGVIELFWNWFEKGRCHSSCPESAATPDAAEGRDHG